MLALGLLAGFGRDAMAGPSSDDYDNPPDPQQIIAVKFLNFTQTTDQYLDHLRNPVSRPASWTAPGESTPREQFIAEKASIERDEGALNLAISAHNAACAVQFNVTIGRITIHNAGGLVCHVAETGLQSQIDAMSARIDRANALLSNIKGQFASDQEYYARLNYDSYLSDMQQLPDRVKGDFSLLIQDCYGVKNPTDYPGCRKILAICNALGGGDQCNFDIPKEAVAYTLVDDTKVPMVKLFVASLNPSMDRFMDAYGRAN